MKYKMSAKLKAIITLEILGLLFIILSILYDLTQYFGMNVSYYIQGVFTVNNPLGIINLISFFVTICLIVVLLISVILTIYIKELRYKTGVLILQGLYILFFIFYVIRRITLGSFYFSNIVQEIPAIVVIVLLFILIITYKPKLKDPKSFDYLENAKAYNAPLKATIKNTETTTKTAKETTETNTDTEAFCIHCGEKLAGKQKFCANCGAKTE